MHFSQQRIAIVIASLLWVVLIPVSARAATVMGSNGAILTVSKASNIKIGEKINVTGEHFDETVGIYVELCQVVKSGIRPSLCGGGADKTGTTGASRWISSNPPQYGVGLAEPYQPGGRFSVVLKVSPVIGKADCRKIRCAIYIRADHTRGDDRSFDQYIPIQFKK